MSDWLAPLAAVLGGMAGGGGLVAYLQRGKTAAEAGLASAAADKTHAEAESLTVQTIQNALLTVERLSTAKDEQLKAIREDATAQATKHSDEILAQSQKHQDEIAALRTEIAGLVEQQTLIARALSAHGQWDMYVLAHVRSTMPDFPDPPPLGFLDQIGDSVSTLDS